MSAVLEPLVPSSHLQAVEDKLRLHGASMQPPPSPPSASASDFILADNESASSASSPSSPSTPISTTTAALSNTQSDQPDQPQPASPPRPARLTALLSPTPKKLSAIITPPSPVPRAVSDGQSSEELPAASDGVVQALADGSDGGDSLQLPTAGSPLLFSSSGVAASPSPEPLPLPDDLIEDASTNASPSPSPIPTSASSSPALSSKPSYPEDSLASRQLKLIYKVFHTICDLFFNVDKDLHNLTDKRQRHSTKGLETGLEALHSTAANHRRSIPATVSPGYGELARRGFDKVLYYLCHDAPDVLRMGEDCSFLDVGSGFGKCVLHAKVRGRVRESVGIEYIPVRHEKAAETLHLLRARFVPGVTDVYEQGTADDLRLQELLASVDLDGVCLVQGDITDEKHQALLYRASHIYMFDVVFSDHTMAKILPAIEQANFALFACYHRPAYLERLGCTQFVCIHQMAMKTTGKQQFTCYFYVKAAAGAKVTRHTQRQWVEAAREERSTGADHGDGEDEADRVAKKRKRKAKTMLFSTKKGGAHSKKASRRKPALAQQPELEEEEVEEQAEDEEEDEQEEEAEAEEEEEAEQRKRERDRRSRKKRSMRVEMVEPPPVVPVVEKKKREITAVMAEVLARDAFNAAVIKAVAARLVIEAEREARLQRRYALSIMHALLSEQDAAPPASEPETPQESEMSVLKPPAALEDDAAPPLFERASTVITDVHGTNGIKDRIHSPILPCLPIEQIGSPSAAATSKFPPSTAVYPPSSLSLLPLSPNSKRSPAKVHVDASSTASGLTSPSKVSFASVPSSSLCSLSTPPLTTPSGASHATFTLSQWTATAAPAKLINVAVIPSTASTTPSSCSLPKPSSTPLSPSSPPQPLTPPSHVGSPSRYICPYCSSCVRCVSECFQLPRRQLNRKQILTHGTRHAMPLLLRVLPSAVQACVEAWDAEQGTEARHLLPWMERTAAAGGLQENGGPHRTAIYASYRAPAAYTAAVHRDAVAQNSTTTSSRKREREPAAGKRKAAATNTSTAPSRNAAGKFVRAAQEEPEQVEQVQQQVEQPSQGASMRAEDVKAHSAVQAVLTGMQKAVTAMQAVAEQSTEMEIDIVG